MKTSVKEKILLFKIRTNQDEQAFAALYDLYIEKIYRFVFFKVSNKEEAEDITSDVFLRAWNHLVDPEKSAGVRHFRGFIYQIARNRIIDLYREKSREREHVVDIDRTEDIATDESVIEAVHVLQESERLLALIKQLKQEYQEVLLLKYIEEMTTREIADIIGKRPTAVRVLLHRATKKLQTLASQ